MKRQSLRHGCIKICGITTAADAIAAIDAGADAIGLNFYKGPRRIGIETGREIAERAGDAWVVGLFASAAEFASAAGVVERLDAVQLYAENRDPIAMPWWRVAHAQDIDALKNLDVSIRAMAIKPGAIVLDTYSATLAGGTGRAWRWSLLREGRAAGLLVDAPPLILAGGLTADNVAAAVAASGCDGVDVSSGVESRDTPGRKDHKLLRKFIQSAREAFATVAT